MTTYENIQRPSEIDFLLENYPNDDFRPLWRARLERTMEMDFQRERPSDVLEETLNTTIKNVHRDVNQIISDLREKRLFRKDLLEPRAKTGQRISSIIYESDEVQSSLNLKTSRSSISFTYKNQDFNQQITIMHSRRPKTYSDTEKRVILDLNSDWHYPLGAIAPHKGPSIGIVKSARYLKSSYEHTPWNINNPPKVYINEEALDQIEGILEGIQQDLGIKPQN